MADFRIRRCPSSSSCADPESPVGAIVCTWEDCRPNDVSHWALFSPLNDRLPIQRLSIVCSVHFSTAICRDIMTTKPHCYMEAWAAIWRCRSGAAGNTCANVPTSCNAAAGSFGCTSGVLVGMPSAVLRPLPSTPSASASGAAAAVRRRKAPT